MLTEKIIEGRIRDLITPEDKSKKAHFCSVDDNSVKLMTQTCTNKEFKKYKLTFVYHNNKILLETDMASNSITK